MRALACVCIGAVFAPGAVAEIFKCTDASGAVLYSDAPCPGGSRAQLIELNDNAPPPAKAGSADNPRTPANAATSDGARQPTKVAAPDTAASAKPVAPDRPLPVVRPVVRAVDPPTATPRDVPPRAGQVRPEAGGRYELSVNERQRLADLQQLQAGADNGEKREAARMEIAEIQRGTLARMSFDDLRKKDGFWTDLGNDDGEKRQSAVQQLAALFAAYR